MRNMVRNQLQKSRKSLPIVHAKVYQEMEDSLGRHICIQDGVRVACPKTGKKKDPKEDEEDALRQLTEQLSEYPEGDLKRAAEKIGIVTQPKEQMILDLAKSILGEKTPDPGQPKYEDMDHLRQFMDELGDRDLTRQEKEELVGKFNKAPVEALQGLQGGSGKLSPVPVSSVQGQPPPADLISRPAMPEERGELSRVHGLPEESEYPSYVIGFVQKVKSSPFHQRKSLFDSLYKNIDSFAHAQAPPSPVANKPVPQSQTVPPSHLKKEPAPAPQPVQQPQQEPTPQPAPEAPEQQAPVEQELPAEEPTKETSQKPESKKPEGKPEEEEKPIWLEEFPLIEDLFGVADLTTGFTKEDMGALQKAFISDNPEDVHSFSVDKFYFKPEELQRLLKEGFVEKSLLPNHYDLTLKGLVVKHGGHIPLPNTIKNIDTLTTFYNRATKAQKDKLAKHFGLAYAPPTKESFAGLVSEQVYLHLNPDFMEKLDEFQTSPEMTQFMESAAKYEQEGIPLKQAYDDAEAVFRKTLVVGGDYQITRNAEEKRDEARKIYRNYAKKIMPAIMKPIIGEQPELKYKYETWIKDEKMAADHQAAVVEAADWLTATTVPWDGIRPDVRVYTSLENIYNPNPNIYDPDLKIVAVSAGSPDVALHEFCHAQEHQSKRFLAYCKSFLAHVTKGDTPIKLGDLNGNIYYRKLGRKDNFEKVYGPLTPKNVSPAYAGLIARNYTEVYTVGMQRLFLHGPAAFKDYPAYLAFLVGAMTGKLEAKSIPDE